MAHSVNGFNGLQDARLIELKKLIGLIELKKDKGWKAWKPGCFEA
jgi:hypothetical protein